MSYQIDDNLPTIHPFYLEDTMSRCAISSPDCLTTMPADVTDDNAFMEQYMIFSPDPSVAPEERTDIFSSFYASNSAYSCPTPLPTAYAGMESGIDFGRSARRGRRLHHPSIYHPITRLKISIDDKKERPERKTFHDRSNRIIDMVKRSEPNGKQAIVCMIRASSIANPKNKTKFHASPGPLGDLMQSIDLPGILHNIAEVHQFRNKKLEGSMNTNKRAHLEERIRRAKAEIAREHLEQKRLQVLMQRPPAPTVIDYTTILGHGYEGLQ